MKIINDQARKILCYGLQLIEKPENSAVKQALLHEINEYSKMYHLTIKPIKTVKKPSIRTLILFAAGSDISIQENVPDMQTVLNELIHSIK